MNPLKQHRKLFKLAKKAEQCLTREQAQKLISKADKARAKLDTSSLPEHSGELS